ncbi:hypothetical protein [Nocardia sp. NPDC048505]|uniref:hypothetical protein n=1 Tax=unclassified Nocardia TaxID=2637762 RepID=UPI0033F901B9
MHTTRKSSRRTLARVAVAGVLTAIPLTALAIPASATPGSAVPGVTEAHRRDDCRNKQPWEDFWDNRRNDPWDNFWDKCDRPRKPHHPGPGHHRPPFHSGSSW